MISDLACVPFDDLEAEQDAIVRRRDDIGGPGIVPADNVRLAAIRAAMLARRV